MTELTKEQRQLLAVYPTSMIADTVVDADRGLSAIRSGCCGGSRLDGPIRHFHTGNGRIEAGELGGEPDIVVTFAQLKRWAEAVPEDLRRQIIEVRSMQRSEATRVWKWCHCPKPQECVTVHRDDPLYGGRYHPTAEEDAEHRELSWELHARERALVEQALGLGDDPVGQLDLFDELMG